MADTRYVAQLDAAAQGIIAQAAADQGLSPEDTAAALDSRVCDLTELINPAALAAATL